MNEQDKPSQYFVLSETGFNGGPLIRATQRYLRKGGSLVKAPPSGSKVENTYVTASSSENSRGKIVKVSARPADTSPSSPKVRIALFMPTDESDYTKFLKRTRKLRLVEGKTDIKPETFIGGVLTKRKNEYTEPVPPPKTNGIEVVAPLDSETAYKSIRSDLLATRYWSGEQRQQTTPDLLVATKDFIRQIADVSRLETQFLKNVMGEYIKTIKRGDNNKLVQFLEGNLAGTDIMQVLRGWAIATPPDDPINYYRPDIGVISTAEGRLRPYLCEVNIETAGTPPAVLYRRAQNKVISRNACVLVASGSDEFICTNFKTDRSVLAVVGVTPQKESQALYEKDHADLAEVLSASGLPSGYSRITDLDIRGGKLFLRGSEKPITTVFWRIQPFQEETLGELCSEQGQLLQKLYADGDIQIFPKPCLPFMDNKFLEAVIWDENFSGLVPNGLREYVPRTERLTPGSKLARTALRKAEWKNFILKRAVGAGGGIALGCETPKAEFVEEMSQRTSLKPDSIIQEFLQPESFQFRTKNQSGNWSTKRYYLRVEPTIGISNDGSVVITDLFFTGNYDTRKVAGSKTCIMGTIVTRKDAA